MRFVLGVIAFVACYFLGKHIASIFDSYLADRWGINPPYNAETPIERILGVHYD